MIWQILILGALIGPNFGEEAKPSEQVVSLGMPSKQPEAPIPGESDVITEVLDAANEPLDANELDYLEDEEEYYYYYYDDEDEDHARLEVNETQEGNGTRNERLPQPQPWIFGSQSPDRKEGDQDRFLNANLNFGQTNGKDLLWLTNFNPNVLYNGTQYQTIAALGNAALVLGSALGMGLLPGNNRRSSVGRAQKRKRRPPFPFYPPRKPFIPRTRSHRRPVRRRRPAGKRPGRGQSRRRRPPGSRKRPRPRKIPTFSYTRPEFLTPDRPRRPQKPRQQELTYRRPTSKDRRKRPRPSKVKSLASTFKKPQTTPRHHRPPPSSRRPSTNGVRPLIDVSPVLSDPKYRVPQVNTVVIPKNIQNHKFTQENGYSPIVPPGHVFYDASSEEEHHPTLYRDSFPDPVESSAENIEEDDFLSGNDFLKNLREPEFAGLELDNPFRRGVGNQPYQIDPFKELKIIVNGVGSTGRKSLSRSRSTAQSRIPNLILEKEDNPFDRRILLDQMKGAASHPGESRMDPFKIAQIVDVTEKADELNQFLETQIQEQRSPKPTATFQSVPARPLDPVLKELQSQLPLFPPKDIILSDNLGIASHRRLPKKVLRRKRKHPQRAIPVYLEELHNSEEAQTDASLELDQPLLTTILPSGPQLSERAPIGDGQLESEEQQIIEDALDAFPDFEKLQ